MSRRGLDDIGDISNMKTAQAFLSGTSSRFVRHGQDLLHIEWGAHIITTADELYHTQWETIFDTSTIKAPVSGKVEDIQLLASPEEEELDEDMVLVTLKTDAVALREGMEREGWMVEHDYDEYIQHAPPGKFQSD